MWDFKNIQWAISQTKDDTKKAPRNGLQYRKRKLKRLQIISYASSQFQI